MLGEKKRFQLCCFESQTHSKGSKLKTAKRKKTKTVLTLSLDETDTKMEMGLEDEATMNCEENEDMNKCVDEDYEKELDCNLINPGLRVSVMFI